MARKLIASLEDATSDLDLSELKINSRSLASPGCTYGGAYGGSYGSYGPSAYGGGVYGAYGPLLC